MRRTWHIVRKVDVLRRQRLRAAAPARRRQIQTPPRSPPPRPPGSTPAAALQLRLQRVLLPRRRLPRRGSTARSRPRAIISDVGTALSELDVYCCRLSTELRRRSCCCWRAQLLPLRRPPPTAPARTRPGRCPAAASAEGCREPPPPSLRMAASVYCAKAERRLEPSRDALAWSEGPVPGVPCAGRPWLMESSAAASAASACCAGRRAPGLRRAAAPPPREAEERPWRLALPARSRSMLLSARLSPPPPECAPRLVLLDCGPLLCAAPPGCCAAAALAAAAFLFACRRLRLHCNVAVSGKPAH